MKISITIPDALKGNSVFLAATRIVSLLKKNGFETYIVGGAPRDILLGLKPKDFDIATSAHPETIQTLFPHSHALGASFGVITVIEDGFPFEVATFREERDYLDGRRPDTICYTSDPVLDVQRRDFTINALLLEPETGVVYDHTGGLEDLRRGVIRTVGDPATRFSEDYLRMLRAIRFAARLKYELDSSALDAIRLLASKTSLISAERIREELTKMLLGSDPERAFRMLSSSGILKTILPEIESMHGLEQPEQYHPEGDVFEHTMRMLGHIAFPSEALCWSVLLHDVGKNVTQSFDENGIPHFYGHEAVGADMALIILKRLKMPRVSMENVYSAVKNHMRFAHVDKMRTAKWRRIISNPNFSMELELHRIDCISSHALLGNYVLMLDRMYELENSTGSASMLPPPLLNGNDLRKLGFDPGPEIGRILREVADLQLEGALLSQEAALEYVRSQQCKVL